MLRVSEIIRVMKMRKALGLDPLGPNCMDQQKQIKVETDGRSNRKSSKRRRKRKG